MMVLQHFNPRNNYFSHLDVTACSDSISHKFQWSVYHDKLSSDHYHTSDWNPAILLVESLGLIP